MGTKHDCYEAMQWVDTNILSFWSSIADNFAQKICKTNENSTFVNLSNLEVRKRLRKNKFIGWKNLERSSRCYHSKKICTPTVHELLLEDRIVYQPMLESYRL